MASEHKLIDSKRDYIPIEIIDCLKNPSFSGNTENLFPQNKKLLSKTNKNNKPPKLPTFFDISAVRGDEIKRVDQKLEKIPLKTMIPEEYHLLKDSSKSYLEYEDHEHSSIEEAEKAMILFPTEFPVSREEVIYLSKTLNKMLENKHWPDKSIDQYSVDNDNDIDKMIELIYSLNGIYNIILHELARQISSSSEARGSVVLELRKKYIDLVCRLPDELLKLKSDVKEQIVKDKKLTLQIEEFQKAIKYLTDQLKEVKERDIKVTENAENIHKELEAALQDSARSKELLDEYHVLYDLQRQRLDKQMSVINNEKEEWSSLTFALSLKISDESLLNSSKRLRLVTKKLFQLSQHFAIYISDYDTVLTSKIQEISGKCLKEITNIHTQTNKIMNNFHDLFYFLEEKFQSFTKLNINDSNDQINIIVNHLNSLKSFLDEESLKNLFIDVSLVRISNYQSIIRSINELLEEWQINTNKLIDRKGMQNDSTNGNYELLKFLDIFETIKMWTNEFTSRINIIKSFEPFFDDLKSCIRKIESVIEEVKLKNSIEYNKNIELLITMINDLYLEIFNNQELKAIGKNEDFTEFNKFYNNIQTSLVAFSNTIDHYDSQLLQNIIDQQTKITNWIIDALFLFSNMGRVDDIEIKFKDFSETFESLVLVNNNIFQYTIKLTEILSLQSEENKKIEMDEYTEENNLWTNIAELLIKNIGDKIERELLNRRKKSEKTIEDMSLDNLNDLINHIIDKTNDSTMFLAIDTVKNLKNEIDETVTRMISSKEKQTQLSNTLIEQKQQIKELEDKIALVTAEYREFVKTD